MASSKRIEKIHIETETSRMFKRNPFIYGEGPDNVLDINTAKVIIITFADGTITRQYDIELEFENKFIDK